MPYVINQTIVIFIPSQRNIHITEQNMNTLIEQAWKVWKARGRHETQAIDWKVLKYFGFLPATFVQLSRSITGYNYYQTMRAEGIYYKGL